MSTTSTLGVLNIIRTRLLTYVPENGTTLAMLLGSTSSGAGSDGKLYLDQAPDNLTGYYGVLRLLEAPTGGFNGGKMLRGLIECHLYGKPRTPQTVTALHRMADVVTLAWQRYLYTENTDANCVIARDVESRVVVFFEAPADRELVLCRLLLPFATVPQFLTA